VFFIVFVRNVCSCVLQFVCFYVLNLCATSKYSSNYLSAHAQGAPNAAYQRELLVPYVSCWVKESQMLFEILLLFVKNALMGHGAGGYSIVSTFQ
jgi:hypothetical protein